MFTWWTMPVPGGTTRKPSNAFWPQRRNWKRSRLRWNSSATFFSKASGLPNTSATTEWSMTSSAGISGLIFFASPPRVCIASRIAARSTTAGTPVRSCRITRAGVNWISVSGSRVFVPVGERGDVLPGDVLAVFVAEQVLEQDLQAVREGLAARDRVQAVYLVRRAACLKRRAAAEAVRSHRWLSLLAQLCVLACLFLRLASSSVSNVFCCVRASAVSPGCLTYSISTSRYFARG